MRVEEIIEVAATRKCPVRQSTVKDAYKCQRYFMLKHKWGLYRKSRTTGIAAKLGQIVHKLMEHGPEGLPVVRSWLRDMQSEILSQIDRGEDLDGSLSRKVQDLTDAYRKAEAVVSLYWEKYSTPIGQETVADEKLIEVDYNGIPLQGRIDNIVRSTSSRALWLRDYKTSTKALALIGVGYQYSIQCRLYRLLGYLYFKEDLKGFILDKMRMPSIKMCKKDANFEAYVGRCRDWYKEQNEDWASSEAIFYNEPIENSELVNAIQKTSELSKKEPVIENFDRDVTCAGCTFFNSVCPYYELCSTAPKLWNPIIDDDYEVKEPEPEEPGIESIEE